jgi:hypothetical protein
MGTQLREMVASATVDGQPFAGAWIVMTVPMWSKNAHHILFGPTDDDGRFVISVDAIRAGMEFNAAQSPMDYTLDVAWDSPFGVALLTREGAHQALEAMTLWDLDATFPRRRQQLESFVELSDAGEIATLNVSVVPECSAVVTVSG